MPFVVEIALILIDTFSASMPKLSFVFSLQHETPHSVVGLRHHVLWEQSFQWAFDGW